jgi:hypothetical protein
MGVVSEGLERLAEGLQPIGIGVGSMRRPRRKRPIDGVECHECSYEFAASDMQCPNCWALNHAKVAALEAELAQARKRAMQSARVVNDWIAGDCKIEVDGPCECCQATDGTMRQIDDYLGNPLERERALQRSGELTPKEPVDE